MKLYAILSGIYLLVFGLTDLVGDERAKLFEEWWLEQTKKTSKILLENNLLSLKFFLFGITGVLVFVVIYGAPLWLIWSYFAGDLPTRKLEQLWEWGLLFFVVIFPVWLVITASEKNTVANLMGKWVPEIKSCAASASETESLHQWPWETRWSVTLATVARSNAAWSVTTYITVSGFFLLLGLGSIWVLLTKIGWVTGLTPEQQKIARPVFMTFMFGLFYVPALPWAVAALLMVITALLGVLIRTTVSGILIVIWGLFLWPAVVMNQIATVTGQTSFLKVGKYVVALVNLIVALVLL